MPRIRFTIEIKPGREVELLYSATLGMVAQRKGIELVLDDPDDSEQNIRFFVKLTYLAALNAWEYKSLDDPHLGDFPFRAIDFAEWAGANPKDFARLITESGEALSGLVREASESAAEKKKNRD